MALAECKVVTALLFLVAALFLLADALPFDHHGSSRLRGPGAALADLLLAALERLRDVDVVGLATRRNMVLLCHAILLVVLRDAGLLGTPARRRRSASAATTTSDVFVAAGACFYSPPESSLARSAAVAWRPRNRAVAGAKNAAAVDDDIGRLERHRRCAWRAVTVEDPCAAPSSADQPEQGPHHQEPTTKAIVLVAEDRQATYLDDHQVHHHLVSAQLHQHAALDDCKTILTSTLDFGGAIVVVADGERNRAEEDATAEEGESPHDYGQEEEQDLDDMNRRFEAFIADTKKRMRLEELQPASGARRRRKQTRALVRTESMYRQSACRSS